MEGTVFICDEESCGKEKASRWSGPPQGWVRLDANAFWDGTNYHILEGERKWHFCSIACFIKHLKKTSRQQGD